MQDTGTGSIALLYTNKLRDSFRVCATFNPRQAPTRSGDPALTYQLLDKATAGIIVGLEEISREREARTDRLVA